MGNGILIIADIPLTKSIWPSDELNLIAVAQLADWHGYDRLLKALFVVNKQSLPYKINLTIVGDGAALALLKQLADTLQLNNVTFTGRLTGTDLDKVFEQAHIGVASLGLYRIGLAESSVLKTREYMARGLSVLAAGKDPDFDKDSPFRFEVKNADEVESIVKCLADLPIKLQEIEPHVAREYAVQNLSIESKVKDFLGLV